MIDAWSLVLFVHLVGATIWVGGQLTLALIVVPVARAELPDDQRLRLMRTAGRRYAVIAVAFTLPLQVATGLALVFHAGVSGGALLGSEWGQILSAKLGLLVVAVALAALHGALSARERNREARWASLGGMAASLGVLFLAAALVP